MNPEGKFDLHASQHRAVRYEPGPESAGGRILPQGLQAEQGGKGRYVNHNQRFYVNEELLKTGVRLQAKVVMDFLAGKI
jgi:hypothetical protein